MIVGLSAGLAWSQSPPPYVYSGPLLPLLLQMPQNSWLHANANLFSNVWTPDELEPLDQGATHTPSKIILAWSGFGWDSNRGDLILFGGGHANYSGNDVYRWHTSNLLWERASLPSEIKTEPLISQIAVDGVDNAPISSHTYDNNLFLPIADRFITWGGAAYNNGGPFTRLLESDPTQTRLTGPYLFDPNRADGTKVGGTTGSHVKRVAPHPEIVGGQMWENRDVLKWVPGSTLPGNHINGCTGYATEGGRDVVYVASSSRFASSRNLHRYQLSDIADPAADTATQVGVYSVGVTGMTTCGYDPVRKLFVRTGNNSVPFQYWDLTTPGPANPDRSVQVNASIATLQSWLSAQALDIQYCGLEFDPTRGTFQLWCGAAAVWELTPPASGNTPTGWSIVQRSPAQPAPPGDLQTGVLGKWRYAPYYDVFIGLQDINDGDIWIYKPAGWVQPNPPGNALPAVSITSPTAGTSVAPSTNVVLQASASDADGSIVRVEYYVNGTKAGQATSPPYTVSIAPIIVGTYSVIAVAVDNVGGMKASAPVTFSVDATLTTTVLQRGLNSYAGASDTYLDNFAPTAVHGATTPLYLDPGTYMPLVRFAIFQSEGGPVPDGAIIQSAVLSLYKQSYDDTLRLDALLKPWAEMEATWTNATLGTAWSVGGAGGAGTDYSTPADAVVTGSFNPGWVDFDVTARARQWSGAPGTNNGWRLVQTVTNPNLKQFNSSEYTTDATLRPKLAIVYSVPTASQPPTVSITSPASGAGITLGQGFTITASASDPDGTVTKVDYYANGVPIGTDTTAPYSIAWTPGAVGNYSLTAIATDNDLATTTSAPVNVTVNPVASGATVVLQRGLSGYDGVGDTFLDNHLQNTTRNTYPALLLNPGNYVPLVRFLIFQSEGGPVPDGANVQSATLSLYKQYYNDTYGVYAMLKPWFGTQATWLVSQTGVPWSVAGAGGAGSDYNATADALVSGPFNPGWLDFNVTTRVQQWSGNPTLNRGWKVAQTGPSTNDKQFNSSDYTTNATLRPKLTIVYNGDAANIPPTVSLTSPASGATITLGDSFTLTASASDADGTVSKVDFYANGAPVGTDSTAPYSIVWTPSAAGNYSLTAVATDNGLATTTSAATNVTVNPVGTGATIVLQNGLAGYAGATDTFLDNFLRTTVRGGATTLYLDPTNYSPLVRFAIYQTEGGPVPNGATIQSATLALYKQYYGETLRLNALLKPWVQGQATWINASTGVPWSAGGAAGAGTDYNSTSDALVTPSFNPGWVTFNVTARVQQWASGSNFGWRMAQTTPGSNSKIFDSSEYTVDSTLRPKLTIVYQ